jgi:hypothetical protein
MQRTNPDDSMHCISFAALPRPAQGLHTPRFKFSAVGQTAATLQAAAQDGPATHTPVTAAPAHLCTRLVL